MNNKSPLVSVIMPVFNAEMYIREAVESILGQTFSNFELLVMDDCSTDKTSLILAEYEKIDSRIKIMRSNENKGIVYNLNKGLLLARGRYIARMDGDDISMSTRLDEQVKYLESNRNVLLCGTWTRNMGANVNEWHIDDDNEVLAVRMLFRPVLAHPTFMMRRDIIDRYQLKYNEKFYPAEDYEFAVNVTKYGEIGIVKKELLRYRIHAKQISSVNKERQEQITWEIRKNYAQRLDIKIDEIGYRYIDRIVTEKNINSYDEIVLLHRKCNSMKMLANDLISRPLNKVISSEFIQYVLHSKKVRFIVKTFICELSFEEKLLLVDSIFKTAGKRIRRIKYL